MTWDVYAVRAPRGVRTIEDIPAGYLPPAIGTPEEVVATIREVAPHVDDRDPRWLVLSGPDHSLEVALGKDVQVHDLTFYIAVGAERNTKGAVALVRQICRALVLTPYDTETGEVLTDESGPPVGPPPDEDDEADDGRPWWRKLWRR